MCILISSCSTEQVRPHNMYFNDFDNYVDWGFNNASLFKGDSHSGKYCSRTDATSNFGMGLKLGGDELATMKPNKFIISAWVKSQNSRPSSTIVATFDEGTTNIAWFGLDLSKEITQGDKWIFVTQQFDFPQNLYPEVSFTSYLWNTGEKAVLIDDFSIEFVK